MRKSCISKAESTNFATEERKTAAVGMAADGIAAAEQTGRKTEMKIAVTYEDGQIFQHFGHTESFKVYDIKDDKIASSEVVGTDGSGHGALADFLKEHGVDTLICGGIGGGARMALDEAGIKLYGGVEGDADEAVKYLLAGKLEFDPDVMCSHHGEHHEGKCGEGGCGEHHCGH
jgi:predicted Fe-Mo cluster-binding NifX family protein